MAMKLKFASPCKTCYRSGMKFASATAVADSVPEITASLLADLKREVDDTGVDLLVLFIASDLSQIAPVIAKRLQTELSARVLLACTSEGVIGRDTELEETNSVAVLAAQLPNVTLVPFLLDASDWDDDSEQPLAVDAIVNAPPDTKLFLLLGEPFSTPMNRVLDGFNKHYPDIPIIGGMASGSDQEGENVLLLDKHILQHGVVGVALAGDFEADIIVSQGCRPIGHPLHVTDAERNVMLELDDEPALDRLRDAVDELSDEDRELLRNGLMVGRAVNPTDEVPGRGDFLIRGVMRIDQQTGAVAIGDYVTAGETVQFHLRDQMTATEDLELLLMPQIFATPPQGALLFSCNGRGTRLYDHPNGDIETIQKVLGGVELAGFFCAGEIGPIGGKNFMHGHTASMVIFR